MKDAYMIRNDGKIYDVPVHPYISYDDPYLNLRDGEWFFDITDKAYVKEAFINYVAWFIKFDLQVESNFTEFLRKFDATEYDISEDFIGNNFDTLVKACETVTDNVKQYLYPLVTYSCQNFLRVRYGGLYETNFGIREIYFRISSSGFNWYDLIWKFVYDNKDQIDFVTIVRDEVSTGVKKTYRGPNGLYAHMPVDDFITEKGNPVVEWKNHSISVRRHLALGGDVIDIFNLPMNRKRALDSYNSIVESENRNPHFWNKVDIAMSDILDGLPVRDSLS